ncbi:MAG: hypothetical protein V8S93_13790 [Lachnospiraceae bacterium]
MENVSTVFGVYYAEKYNTDDALTTVRYTYDLTWNADTKTWEAPALTTIPTIKVNCAGDKPEKPVDTEIVPAVIVECLNASNYGHEAKQYDLNIPNSYTDDSKFKSGTEHHRPQYYNHTAIHYS